jgi:hypothetical protein
MGRSRGLPPSALTYAAATLSNLCALGARVYCAVAVPLAVLPFVQLLLLSVAAAAVCARLLLSSARLLLSVHTCCGSHCLCMRYRLRCSPLVQRPWLHCNWCALGDGTLKLLAPSEYKYCHNDATGKARWSQSPLQLLIPRLVLTHEHTHLSHEGFAPGYPHLHRFAFPARGYSWNLWSLGRSRRCRFEAMQVEAMHRC